MDHITIPIPDGMPEDQKADLTGWLTQQVEEMTRRLPCEDDPAWQAETARQIKRGMEDIKAGRCCDSKEAKKRIAESHGFELPR